MSDPNYAPYGVDDDPFLTHPAGVGRTPLRADNRYGQSNGAQQPFISRAAPHQMPPAPQHRSYAPYPDAPYDAPAPEAAPAAWAQHDPWAQHGAEHMSYAASQPQPHPVSQPQYPQHHAPQQGNFRPRDGYDAGHDARYDAGQDIHFDARYAAHPQGHAAGHHAGYSPAQPQLAPQHHRAEPMVNAAQARAMQPSSDDPRAPYHAARAPNTFAAPPRAAQQNHGAQAPRASYGAQAPRASYGAPDSLSHDAAPRSYAPLPPQPAYAGYQDTGFAAGLVPNPARLMQWAGAACTVLALIGAVYWGYALAVRDAHGIPVVRAQVDPLRIAPETPGGEISANQGLAVNNIPAAGTAPAASDQITLAPQVAELAPEDTQIVEGGSFVQPSGAGSDDALAGASDTVLTAPEATGGLTTDLTALPNALPEDMPMTDAEAVERALAAALAEGGDPILDSAPAALAEASLAPAEPASMSVTDPIAPPTAELDPTTIAVGTPLAQLGAFDTPDTARAEWANLQTRFTELMAGKALVVEPAKSGGRDFFRLRAHGFASEDDSRRFCAAILAENGSCFPVDQR